MVEECRSVSHQIAFYVVEVFCIPVIQCCLPNLKCGY